jgi:hypothetical protein
MHFMVSDMVSGGLETGPCVGDADGESNLHCSDRGQEHHRSGLPASDVHRLAAESELDHGEHAEDEDATRHRCPPESVRVSLGDAHDPSGDGRDAHLPAAVKVDL